MKATINSKKLTLLVTLSLGALTSLNLIGNQATIVRAQAGRWEQQAREGQALYSRAVQLFGARNFQACVETCKQAAKLDARNKQIPHLCALAQSETGDFYNADISFRTALNQDPNWVECHNNYGIFLNKKGTPEEAKKQFNECMRLNPSYPKAYYNLGNILQQQGDLDGAVANFRTAVRLDPNYFDAQRDLGLVLFQKFERGDAGEISECLDKLLIAEKLIPTNPLIHYHLGMIYCSNGNLDEGEAELRKALMNDREMAAGHYELARLRFLRGDPNRGLFEVKVAQKLSPLLNEGRKYPPLNRVYVKTLQARCEELTGNYNQALESWKEVAALTANNTATKKHITEVQRMARSDGHRGKNAASPEEVKETISQGISEVESGNLDAAKQTFTKASEMDPKNFIPFQNLGFIYDAQDNLTEAIPMYQKALDLEPKYEGLYYNMAYILEQMDRRAEAGAWYKRFHDLAGKYPYDPKHIVSLQQEDARVKAQGSSH